ncbi:MAG: hypothetical protein IKG27_04590 [Bacilli bacterium]|nr:hypothetical protein [Bacilli bacterium]
MKKVLILLFCIFLLTGCDVTYNLDIDGDIYKETTNIIENYDSVKDHNTLNYAYNLFDIYLNKPIPISSLSPFVSETNEKLDNVIYYDVKDLSDDENFGMEYTGTFDNKNLISDSNILAFAVGRTAIEKNEKTIKIEAQNIKIFKQFKNLDNITVNLKTKNKVINHNADNVSKNVYTWYINKNNYDSKIISIEYRTNNKLIDFNSPMVRFTVVLTILILVGFIIYLLINTLYKKKNVL